MPRIRSRHLVLSAGMLALAALLVLPPAALAGTTASHVDHVPVLEYHRFGPLAAVPIREERYTVPTRLFDAQLTALAADGWHTISAAQYASDLANGVAPPAKSFIVTIDDGHSDGLTQALPVLLSHHMTASYYVIGARIGEHRHGLQYLSASDLITLRKHGMEIGNHTLHHVHLARLSARAQFREIALAQARLRRMLGTAPVTMAYPYGSFDTATELAAARAGIRLAFDSHTGSGGSWSSRLDLPRLLVLPNERPSALLARVKALARP